MTRQLRLSQTSVFWACLLLILFSSVPCQADPAQDFRLLISPGTLAGLSMEISFNGRSSAPARDRGVPQGLKMTGRESDPFSDRLVLRFGPDLLKYVNIGTPLDGEALPEQPAGIEGRASERVSLEVQAGLNDLSGALFIMFQL